MNTIQKIKGNKSNALDDKVILVTGAGGGIGRATAIVLARAGAKVVVTDIQTEEGLATVDTIIKENGTASFIPADLSKESEVQILINNILESYGRIDGAFNNAGIAQIGKSLDEISTDEWERAIRVDLTAVFWCMKYQIKAMKQKGGGAIVNTASSLGQVAISNASEYIAAKHGVIGLSRAGAAEFHIHGVRVNSVLPGIIKTPLVASLAEDPRFAEFLLKLKDRHPIGRFGEPEEIGETVAWLMSDAASFVNGASIAVDGGYLAI